MGVMTEQLNNQESSAPKQSRYQRVQEILSEAAGGVCPSYQGYGKFWRLPLAEFLEVTIYGVRMIAPAGQSDPSSCSSSSPGSALPTSGGGLPVMSCCQDESASTPEPMPLPETPETVNDSCCPTPSGGGGSRKPHPGRGAAS